MSRNNKNLQKAIPYHTFPKKARKSNTLLHFSACLGRKKLGHFCRFLPFLRPRKGLPQDGSKMDPEGPKTAQDAPKDGSRRPQDGPKWAPGGFFEAFLGLLKLFRVARVVKKL
jgi:hypothetical protein